MHMIQQWQRQIDFEMNKTYLKDKEVNKEADAEVTDESAAAKEEKLEKMTVSLEKIEELEDQKNVSDDKMLLTQ